MKNPITQIKYPDNIYLLVYITLAVLTLLTVCSFLIGFGRLTATVIGLSIASTKAILIALYYMHLRYERELIYGIVIAGIIAATILTLGILPDIAIGL